MRAGTLAAWAVVLGVAFSGGKTASRGGENLVTLVEAGKSGWRLIVASPRSDPVVFAAGELRKYVGQISGCALEEGRPGEKGPAIVIGVREDLAAGEARLLPGPARGYDGYAIGVAAGDDAGTGRIVIGGDNGRGVIYAVYDLLERLGCRWFYPGLDERDPETIAKRATLSLPAGKWAVASKFRFRGFCWLQENRTPEDFERLYDWALKCRYNRVPLSEQGVPAAKRRGLMTTWGGHGFGHFLKTEDYFKEHPEWFGMQGGKRVHHGVWGSQFCWSNPEARKTFADNLERWVRSHPELDVLAICGLDGVPACTCPECSKLNPSDWEITLMNEVTARLEKTAPSLVIETLGGYPPVQAPPKQTRPHPRLRIEYAHWGRGQVAGYDDPEYRKHSSLEAWCDLFEARMTVFQYYSDHFATPWVAAPYALAIRGDRKYLLERGADGMENLLYPEGYWWQSGLNMYLAGRCFYDASLDPFELLRDYALHYYGGRAGPVMAGYLEEWARNPELAYRVRGASGDSDRARLAEQRSKYLEPALAAAEGDALVLYRLGKAEKVHRLAEQLMEVQRRQQEITRLREAGKSEQALQRLPEARAYLEEVFAYARSLAELQTGLVDEQLLSWFLPRFRQALENEARALGEAGGSDGA
jgi:hypothetical protein